VASVRVRRQLEALIAQEQSVRQTRESIDADLPDNAARERSTP
jgi:hypothetical protein